jgi:hypothetical protein
MDTHAKLAHAAVEYDRKQIGKPGFNLYALSHYLQAIERVESIVAAGQSLREAILCCFTGRLLGVMLKAVGEPKATTEELSRIDREYFQRLGL